MPKTWIADTARCRQAGIPDEADFSSKPELARQMLARAFDAGIPASWVTADCVYGGDRHLRRWREENQQPFVLAVPCNEPLWCQPFVCTQAQEMANALPNKAWRSVSAGAGSKGERWYD